METEKVETISSFLAAALLSCNRVDCMSFSNDITFCEYNYGISFIEPDYDCDELQSIIMFDTDNSIKLTYDYDDIYLNRNTSVWEFLYSLTSEFSRNYFKINNSNIKKQTRVS